MVGRLRGAEKSLFFFHEKLKNRLFPKKSQIWNFSDFSLLLCVLALNGGPPIVGGPQIFYKKLKKCEKKRDVFFSECRFLTGVQNGLSGGSPGDLLGAPGGSRGVPGGPLGRSRGVLGGPSSSLRSPLDPIGLSRGSSRGPLGVPWTRSRENKD